MDNENQKNTALNDKTHDDKKTDKALSFPKRILSKTLDKTLQHTRDAIHFASDTTEDVRQFVGQATDFTKETLDQVSLKTKKGVSGISKISSNAVRGVVTETSDVALHMARTFLGGTPLTLYLPELLLNNQIRKRIDPQKIDHINVQCGNDRFEIEIDGHYRQFLYRLTIDFDVLECRIGQEKFLRLRQNNESLDVQIRHAGTITNWAARRAGHLGFGIINRIPIISIIKYIIRDIPGITQEKHRHWYIDLEKAGFMDFINNRSWMVEKLISLTDFNILPGLNILRESRELVRQLVEQFEISGLRVQPGRLEVQVRIAMTEYEGFIFK